MPCGRPGDLQVVLFAKENTLDVMREDPSGKCARKVSSPSHGQMRLYGASSLGFLRRRIIRILSGSL